MQIGCTEKDANLASEHNEVRSRNECKVLRVDNNRHTPLKSDSFHENSVDNACLHASEMETHSHCQITPDRQMFSNSATRDDRRDITIKDLTYCVYEGTGYRQHINFENANDHGEVNYALCEESKSLAAHSSPESNNRQPPSISHNVKTVCDDEDESSVNVALDVFTALANAEEKVTRLIMERDAISSLYKQMNAQNLQEMQSLRKYFEGKISEQHKIMEQQCKEREAQAKQTADK